MITVAQPAPVRVPAPRRAPLSRLVRMEVRKSLSTRSGVVLTAVASVLPAGFTVLTLALGDSPPDVPILLAFLGTLFGMLMLAVGILSTAGEWTHGTVQVTFLTEPRRHRVIAAKYGAAALLGTAIGVVVVLTTLGVAAVGAGPDFSWAGAGVAIAATVAGGAALTVVGAGVGAAVTNSPAALTGTYLFLLIGMTVLNGLKPVWGGWIDPLGAMYALINGDAAARPIIVLAGWVLVSTLAGAAVTSRRQLT